MPRVALLLGAALLTGALAGAAQGVTKPGRTRVEHAPIVALSVTGHSVTYAVGDNVSMALLRDHRALMPPSFMRRGSGGPDCARAGLAPSTTNPPIHQRRATASQR